MFNWTRLHGLTESFDNEFKFLDEDGEKPSSSFSSRGKSKRRKVSQFSFFFNQWIITCQSLTMSLFNCFAADEALIWMDTSLCCYTVVLLCDCIEIFFV